MATARMKPVANVADRRVLLVGSDCTSDDPRADILRAHGVQVDVAGNVNDARSFWKPRAYDLMLIDVRRYLPGEIIDFCRQIRELYPQQRMAFLVGPPLYLSVNWPEALTDSGDPQHQWEETVRWFLTAS